MSPHDDARRATDEAERALLAVMGVPLDKLGAPLDKAEHEKSSVLTTAPLPTAPVRYVSVPSFETLPSRGWERGQVEEEGGSSRSAPIGVVQSADREEHGLRLTYAPKELMAHPFALPTDTWPADHRSYQAKITNPTDLVIVMAGPDGALRAGPRALVTFVALCSYFRLLAVDQHHMSGVRWHDEWIEVDAAEMHRDLGRKQRYEAYLRTDADIQALMWINYGRSWDDWLWDEDTKRHVLRHNSIGGVLVAGRQLVWSEQRGQYVFRFQLGPFVREHLAQANVGIISTDLFKELRSDLAVSMVLWMRSLTSVPSTRRDGWTNMVRLARLWQLFPTAADRSSPSLYKRLVDRAMDDYRRVGMLSGHEWQGKGWDQVLTIGFDPSSPHVRKQGGRS